MPGLKDFTSAQLNALLGLFKRVRPRQGEVIEAENAPCNNIYIIKEGSVIVQQNLVGDEMPKTAGEGHQLGSWSIFWSCGPHDDKDVQLDVRVWLQLDYTYENTNLGFHEKIPKGDIHHLLN